MAHNHGNEYQIRIVHEDGTEELSGWMNSEEQLAQAMAASHRAQGKAYWLRERNVLCPDCFDKEQIIILECPITDTPSPRYLPHDSHYLVAVGSRNRCELLEVVFGSRHCGEVVEGFLLSKSQRPHLSGIPQELTVDNSPTAPRNRF
jgi:hypothetical protein